MVVDQSYSGQTLDLPFGQVMELRLAENPTTGYRWTFLSNGEPSCVVLPTSRQARRSLRSARQDKGASTRGRSKVPSSVSATSQCSIAAASSRTP